MKLYDIVTADGEFVESLTQREIMNKFGLTKCRFRTFLDNSYLIDGKYWIDDSAEDIPEAELSDAQRAQIEDIVKRKTGIAPENIVITPLKETEDAEDTTQTDETSADTSYEEDSETSAQPYEDTAIDTTDIYD